MCVNINVNIQVFWHVTLCRWINTSRRFKGALVPPKYLPNATALKIWMLSSISSHLRATNFAHELHTVWLSELHTVWPSAYLAKALQPSRLPELKNKNAKLIALTEQGNCTHAPLTTNNALLSFRLSNSKKHGHWEADNHKTPTLLWNPKVCQSASAQDQGASLHS
jgi:hypothetical protein